MQVIVGKLKRLVRAVVYPKPGPDPVQDAWESYQLTWDWGQEPTARDVFAAGVAAGAQIADKRRQN